MKILLGAIAICLSASVQAAEPVYKLLDMMGTKEQMQQMSSKFVSVVLSSNPSLKPYKSVIQDWSDEYLDWESLREDVADIYRNHYSDEELEKLIDFYQTPVGKKTIKLMPQLVQEGSQVGMQEAQKHQDELKKMLDEARAETEDKQADAAPSNTQNPEQPE